mgnify:CR=1 FL=1
MKKVSVSGYVVCEVTQEVEVKDDASEQEIKEQAAREFEGLEEYSDNNDGVTSIGVLSNATIYPTDEEVNFTENYNELVPAPTVYYYDEDETKYKTKEEIFEYFSVNAYKEKYPGQQYPTSPQTSTLKQAIKWNRDYILNLVHTVASEYKDYETGWYCKICIDNESHDIYSTSFIKNGTDIKVAYNKATEIMTLYTEQLKHITDEEIERQINRILNTLEK